MTKELFVSSTPHETKVGMVEEDQLAEIYLERENEYTLAGSIYKGRVTRVLPGMQSAFVDIGLERDAFLYVSDFMELGEDQDDLEEVPTNRPVPVRAYQAPSRTEAEAETPMGNGGSEEPAQPHANETHASGQGESGLPPADPRENRSAENRGGWRGRRRRRGRGRDRFPDSKYARPGSETPREPQRADYGPPLGYQPIVLPGESISKYQRLTQSPAVPAAKERAPEAQEAPLAQMFPEDEPLFAKRGADENFHHQQRESDEASEAAFDSESPEWDREQKRLHEMNVAAVFGGEEREDPRNKERNTVEASGSAGTLEEEEIEEEEADLAHYVEELEEDAAFEEMEEETHAADEYGEHPQEIAASGDPATEDEVPFSSEPVSAEAAEVAEVEGVDEEA